jgi:hypothetical protein
MCFVWNGWGFFARRIAMSISRRQFIQQSGVLGAALASSSLFLPLSGQASGTRLERKSVVRRHNPVFARFDPCSSLSLGNGEFAFTADVTGLQTFATECAEDFPICTAAHWAWHTVPADSEIKGTEFRYKIYDTYGRPVTYATEAKGQEKLFNWLRQNPHGLHLGQIGLEYQHADGSPLKPEDLKNIRQSLDLWSGWLESRFEIDGQPVRVETCCHGELDLLAVRVESPLVAQGKLSVRLAFPYGSHEVHMTDWTKPERHSTVLWTLSKRRAELARTLDDDRYFCNLEWSPGTELRQTAGHEFRIASGAGKVIEFVCLFSPAAHAGSLPSVKRTRESSREHWERFWSEGGMIDLGGSTDSRAQELERRMILSLYQTAIHCAGSLPSAETGLLSNSWYGKFHLEMHWWHSVHFTAWGRFGRFERNMGFYKKILPVAREIARRQGYQGARWPKMVGPDGHDSPSPVGPLLIWQQPHPIYYAELCYRERPTRQTLERWREVVLESADFMASYAVLDKAADRFVLGPPLKTVSENTPQTSSMNPAFELAYWRFGLRVAQQWRERLGLGRNPKWDEVLSKLSPLPTQEGLYLLQEGMADTYTKWNWEHPALVGAYGMQPGDGADPATMKRTIRRVMEVWEWDRAWGWDFGMAAMAAARSGEPELAIQALLVNSPKNRFWPNGHNYQREHLTAYLPGNGSLLCALAMMAGGWTGGPSQSAPGFPKDGKWNVRSEGLRTWV